MCHVEGEGRLETELSQSRALGRAAEAGRKSLTSSSYFELVNSTTGSPREVREPHHHQPSHARHGGLRGGPPRTGNPTAGAAYRTYSY